MGTNAKACKVCSTMEPETVDRLLAVGYGPNFIARRWGLARWRIKKHRDECLVGEWRAGVEADLRRMAGMAEATVEGEGWYLLAKCSGITQAGTACKGMPIDGSQWCYVHHPDHAEERRRHGSKGGKRGGRGRRSHTQAELSEVKSILRGLAGSVLKGTTDRQDAAVVGQLLNTVIRAVSVELKAREQAELIERLEALEAIASGAGQAKPGGERWGA